MRKYSNIGTDREALFLVFSRTTTTLEKERKKEATRHKREREREKKREKARRASFNRKHNHKSAPLFAERKNTEKRLSSLSTHHGEPRSGGNLERVTREKRERGAFLIVRVVVFSLFSFSLIKEARAKSAKDSVPLNEVTPYLRRVFVDPKQIIKRDESFSLFSIVLFSTNERTTTTILASSVLLSSLVVTESLVVVYHSFT